MTHPTRNRFKLKTELTETQLSKDVRRWLHAHPRCVVVARTNSGAAKMGDRFVRFVEIEGQDAIRRALKRGGAEGLAAAELLLAWPDIVAVMDDGRFVGIETKRPGWKSPHDERERAQARFIATVKRCGGIAGFVQSVEDLEALLEQYR